MSMFTQTKLLRVLQERSIQRVGGKETIPVDVRVIAATHADLEQAIQDGRFREDLYYRLSAFVLRLPPLRERSEDIPELTQYLLDRLGHEMRLTTAVIQTTALDLLKKQRWPGNVRQLNNVLRQALVQARGFPVGVEHLQAALRRGPGVAGGSMAGFDARLASLIEEARAGKTANILTEALATAELEIVRRAFEAAGNDETQVARWLGLTPAALRQRLHRLKWTPPAAPHAD